MVLPRPRPADSAVAAVLLLWELSVMGDTLAVALPAALLVTVPLAWRRSAPVVVAVLVAAGFVLQAAQPNPPETLAELVALLVAAWGVGAYGDRAQLLVGVPVVLVAVVGESALRGFEDLGFGLALVGVAVVAGVAVGRRTAQARAADLRLQAVAEQATVEERQRIARELHDVVSHGVSLMVVHAGAAEARLHEDPDVAAASLRRIQDAGRDAVDDLRRMLAVMRPDEAASTDPQPTLDDLSSLVAAADFDSTPVTLACEGDLSVVPPGMAASIHRVVQEALTNVRRHAPGSTAEVRLRAEADAVEVSVRNGPSSGRSQPGAGHGLRGARERVAVYDGRLEAGPTPDGGWLLCAQFPVRRS